MPLSLKLQDQASTNQSIISFIKSETILTNTSNKTRNPFIPTKCFIFCKVTLDINTIQSPKTVIFTLIQILFLAFDSLVKN